VPVAGTVVVALDQSVGDFHLFREVNANAQGNFRFDNVPPVPSGSVGYAIVVAARAAHDPGTAPGAPGSFYTPALLLPGGSVFGNGDPIVPGTNVGTIGLRFTSQGDFHGSVSSTDSSGKVPVPIHVTLLPPGIFTRDFIFDYPWIGPNPSFNTAAGSACSTGTACATYTVEPFPTSTAEEAVFSKSGYTFAPSQTPGNFIFHAHATSLLNGQPTCTTPDQNGFVNTLVGDAANQVSPIQFSGCQ